MTSILHISDLHLGPPEESQWIDDHKSAIASADRRAQKDVLRETIAVLDADGTLTEVEVVVVSGDLTNRACSAGFDEFSELMKPLLKHVSAEKCLVVPGNHDVPWEAGPGDPARYSEFLRVTRAAGFATPLLDGQDFDVSGVLKDNGARARHLLSGEDFVIVPINSSHFCWGREPLSSEAAEELLTTTDPNLAAAVENLRRHDVARVSNAQISALQTLLAEIDETLLSAGDDNRVRIAVLHHQLLPVSAREEMKSFESLTNLGLVRELFAALGIRIVLHGHKHDSALYWDYVADGRGLNYEPHRMLVSAAPGNFNAGQPILRIMRIGERAAARDVVIETIAAPATVAGQALRTTERARLWRRPATDSIGDGMSLRGATTAEVYEQLQSVFAGRPAGEPLYDVMCEIAEPRDSAAVPPGYSPPGVLDIQQWMNDLINWWQLREPKLLEQVGFNHGERIHRRWGDQVGRAANTLRSSSTDHSSTTRAVIVLIDPQSEGGGGGGPFPSFVLIQLQLVPDGPGSRLDCTGYFRKQEMRYWWPINVAELGRIQHEVIERLAETKNPVRPGALRTLTGFAAAEDRLPTVSLPAVDRAIDQHPEDLWMMAYSVKHRDLVDTANARRLWDRYLTELDPPAKHSDSALRISYRGLADVGQMLAWEGAKDVPVSMALSALVRFYKVLEEQGPPRASQTTVQETQALLADLRAELDRLLGPLDS